MKREEVSVMLNKRIPTFVGLLILIIGFLAVIYGLTQVQTLTSKASAATTPRNITFSNFVNGGFTISWTTEQASVGTVLLEKDGRFIRDDRDINKGESHPYFSHHITLNSLQSGNDVYFILLSGETKYGTIQNKIYTSVHISDNDVCELKNVPGIPALCFPIHLKAPIVLPTESITFESVNGVVYDTTGKTPLNDGVVYFSLPDSSIISTPIRENGTWLLSLGLLRSATFTSYYTYKPSLTFLLEIHLGKLPISLSCPFSKDQPITIPAIFEGKRPQCPSSL